MLTNFQPFITLRQELHQTPELSGQEFRTAQKIQNYLEKNYPPDQLISQLGGTGLAAVYEAEETGKSVLIRCELDALPIDEVNDFAYKSSFPHISHKCGHDGHMAILCSLAARLHAQRPKQGRVILLFQPAEEIGSGAQAVYDDPKFSHIHPDYAFALHNLPGYPLGHIILKANIFTCASRAMQVHLRGKTAHAAYPDQGLSPANALTQIMNVLSQLPQRADWAHTYALATLIYARLGSQAAGVAPGEAELLATLRCERNQELDKFAQMAKDLVAQIAQSHQLEYEITWTDVFLANDNDEWVCQEIAALCAEKRIPVFNLAKAIRFSEDFGVFTSNIPGAMVGLGAGKSWPSLHNPDYDFPDSLIEVGHRYFVGILEKFLNT